MALQKGHYLIQVSSIKRVFKIIYTPENLQSPEIL